MADAVGVGVGVADGDADGDFEGDFDGDGGLEAVPLDAVLRAR